MQVKGRTQALRVHELLGAADAPLPVPLEEMRGLYAAALAFYRERRWDAAYSLFEKCLALCPADGPSQLMMKRCLLYRAAPPPEAWNGAFQDRRGAAALG